MSNIRMTIGAPPAVQTLVEAFVNQTPQPTAEDVKNFLRMVPLTLWEQAVQALVAGGVPLETVQSGVHIAAQAKSTFWKDSLTLGSAIVSGFHGARRNDSVLWGAWWFLMGTVFPVFTPVVAFAQGFGKRKS